MSLADLQTMFSTAMAEAEAVKSKVAAAKGLWTPEDVTAFDAAITRAQGLKGAIDSEKKLAQLEAWRKEPDGQTAAKAFGGDHTPDKDAGTEWNGQTLDGIFAKEGVMPGIGMESLISYHEGTNGQKSIAVGELYAFDKVGDQKLKALKSGQYKDAFRAYISTKAFHGADWVHHMKSGHMKVLQEGLDTAGGFWVPPDIRTDLVKKMAGIVGVRANAYSFTTGSNLVQFPKVVYTADNIYTAGTVPSWTAEAPTSSISEATNPVAGRVNIPVETATVAIIITRAMLEDSMFDLLGYISMLIGEAYGLFEDNAFINGTGVNQPQGFMNHPNATTASSSGGMYVALGNASAIPAWEGASYDTTKGILGVEAALPPQYDAGAKWYGSKAWFAAVRGLTDTTGRPLWSIGESYPNFQNGYVATLLGSPIVKDQFMPALAQNAYPVAYGDMQGYYIADRVGLSVEVLREVRALQDEIVIYARKRVGGQLVQDWRLKLGKLASS